MCVRPFLLVLAAALGPQVQVAVGDGDLQVLVGVDAGQLRSHDERVVGHLLLDPHALLPAEGPESLR